MINVAIIGVGNCASSLVQGVEYYSGENPRDGLMHNELGGYKISDIKFKAAFDIDQNKVGKELSTAIFNPPNNTFRFISAIGIGRVIVERGMTHDGIGRYTKDVVIPSKGPTANVRKILVDNKIDVVVNYLPVGSEEATKWYVEQVLAAGCAFVNCMPVFIASDKTGYWPSRFVEAGVPVLGDDIKSQIGATIIHRTLAKLFEDRGVTVDRTYQLNFGGNTDFQNMLDRDRLHSKKISKTGAVQSEMVEELKERDIHVGPSDYVPWLQDRKWAYIRLEGRNFGGAPVSVEVKLEVHDSPNSAGIVIDAIRCAKLAMDRKLSGPVPAASAYYFKTPPEQITDSKAKKDLEEWINGI